MNKQNLAEQLKYSSSHSLYVITWNNLLKQIFTPFKVIVIKPIGSLEQGQIVLVDKVKVTSSLTTVFVINGSAYYFHYFDILID